MVELDPEGPSLLLSSRVLLTGSERRSDDPGDGSNDLQPMVELDPEVPSLLLSSRVLLTGSERRSDDPGDGSNDLQPMVELDPEGPSLLLSSRVLLTGSERSGDLSSTSISSSGSSTRVRPFHLTYMGSTLI